MVSVLRLCVLFVLLGGCVSSIPPGDQRRIESVSIPDSSVYEVANTHVADLIRLPRLVSLTPGAVPGDSSHFYWSPDNRHVAFAYRVDDPHLNLSEVRLHVLSEGELQSVFEAPHSNSKSLPDPVAIFTSDSNRSAVRQARWTDNQWFSFVGERIEDQGQIYSYDTNSRSLQRFSDLPRATKTFDLNPALGRFVAAMEVNLAEFHASRVRFGYEVTTEPANDVFQTGQSSVTIPTSYVFGGADAPPAPIQTTTAQHLIPPYISIAPNGKYAALTVRPEYLPGEWIEYDFGPLQSIAEIAEPGETPAPWARSLALVNLETGVTEPLTNAPLAITAPPITAWSPDGEWLAVSNTYVATESADQNERRPVLGVVDLESNEPLTVLMGIGFDEPHGELQDLSFSNDGARLVASFSGAVKQFEYGPRGWQAVQNGDLKVDSERRFSFSYDESLSERPSLVLNDHDTDRQISICEFSYPWMEASLLSGETYEWTDANGEQWEAGLIKPRGHGPWPLIIQTHGHYPDQFLVTGPMDAAAGFSAQGFAASGFLVLQVGEKRQKIQQPDESAFHVEGYKGAIAALAAEGLADPARVGIIGWSRTGFYVQHALAFEPDLFAAASVVDASGYGVLGYSLFHNFPAMFQHDYILKNGSPPYGEALADWISSDPSVNADQIETPLRIEAYGNWITPWWEVYATMSELERPVSFYHLPSSTHAPTQPIHKYISQAESIKWFSRWLKPTSEASPTPVTK